MTVTGSHGVEANTVCRECREPTVLHYLEIKEFRGDAMVDNRTVVQGRICENGHESDIWGRLRV